MNSDAPIKILFLASDPSDASRLRLGQELRDIQTRLQLAKQRERFVLEQRLSVRPGDISQALLDVEPQIVHFSGHGTNTGELCCEDELGKIKPVQSEALAALFELVDKHVKCVVLNACYSEIQADAIAKHIQHVIGMNQAIGDRAAIAFAVGFYKALGANRPIDEAYKFGCVEIQLEGIPEHLTPVIYSKESNSQSYFNQELLTPEFPSEPELSRTDIKLGSPTDGISSKQEVDSTQETPPIPQKKNSLCLHTLCEHSNTVRSVAFSSNGQILASGSSDKKIKLWNPETGEQIHTLSEHLSEVYSVIISPDSQTLASGSSDGEIKLWNLTTGELLSTLVGHLGAVTSVAFSPDGKILASSSADKTIKIWKVSNNEILHTFSGHADRVTSVAFSPDGQILASGSADKKVKLWSLSTANVIRNLEEHSGWISSVAISPDGRTLTSGSADRTIKIWRVSSISDFGKKPPSVKVPIKPDRIKSESTADSSSSEQKIKLNESLFEEALNIADAAWLSKQRTRLKGDQIAVLRAAWYRKNYDEIEYETKYSAEYLRRTVSSKFWSLLSEALREKVNKQTFRAVMQRRLQTQALRRRNNTKQVQKERSETSIPSQAANPNLEQNLPTSELSVSEPQIQNWKCVHSLIGHIGGVNSVAINPDGQTLASGSEDTKIKIWNLHTGKEIRTLGGLFAQPHSKSVHSIAISWDGQILVSGSEDTKIKIWDLHTGKLLHTLSEHSKPVYAVAISPDNQTLASGSADTTIRIWNLKTGKKRDTLIRHSRAVQSIAFSPDGKILVSGSEDTTIKIWNPDTGGNPLRDITTQTWSVYSVAVSCDGQILTIGSGDNIIRVLNLPTEELLRIVKGHSLAISPDGQTLATSQDKTIMIWNLLTGELLCNLRGHSGSVRTLSFSTNGRLLASGSYDKTIRIWQRS